MARMVKTPMDVPNLTTMAANASDKDKAFVAKVVSLRGAAEGERSKASRHWEHYYRMWATDQWHDMYVDDWRSQPQVNYIYSTVELDVATITDQNPETVVFPVDSQNPEAADSAEILNRIFQHEWRRGYGQTSFKQWVRGSRIYGTAFMKVGFDPATSSLTFNYLPPDQLIPDPHAGSDLQKAWYMHHQYIMSYNDVKKHWPGKAKMIAGMNKDEARADASFERDHYAVDNPEGDVSKNDGTLTYDAGNGDVTPTRVNDNDSSLNWETSAESVNITEFWEKGQDGRIRVSYIANDSILLDTVDEPLGERVNMFPFVRMVCTPVDNEMWGMSLIQPLEPLQISVNKRRQQVIDHMRFMTSPILVAEEGTIDEDVVIDTPGTIITVDRPEAVQWLQVPQIGTGPFQLQAMDRQDFETIAGAFDVVQGRSPGGIEAAAAIMALQEAAQVRQRDRMSEMERALEELARMSLLMIQSNYSEEKALNLMGHDGQAIRVTINRKIKPEELTEEDVAELQAAYIAVEEIGRALDITKGEFDIQLVAGSTVKPPEAAILNKMLTLYDRNIIPQDSFGAELVLRALNFPAVDDVVGYLEAKEQAAAEEMAQQEAMMQGGMAPEGQVGPGGLAPTEATGI